MSELPVSPECEAARPELNAYVDGELALEERTVVERHLEGCADCRAQVELLRLVRQSLRLAARPEPSEAMRQRLLAQVSAELQPRRTEILCVERHGDRVIRRREVRTYHEPDRRRLETVSESVVAPVIQHFRRVLTDGPNCYQVIESYYGRDYHERRA
jgi:anti-sigma factor RsiW